MEWYEQYFGKGTRKLTVYRDRKYRMFLVPDENIQLPPNHNCDAMGCGSVGPHIIGVYLPATKHDALKESLTKLVEEIRIAVSNMQKPPVLAEGEWQTGMFCGLEDRGINDRYDACVYGHDQALEKVQEWVIDGLEQAIAEAQKL